MGNGIIKFEPQIKVLQVSKFRQRSTIPCKIGAYATGETYENVTEALQCTVMLEVRKFFERSKEGKESLKTSFDLIKYLTSRPLNTASVCPSNSCDVTPKNKQHVLCSQTKWLPREPFKTSTNL